MHFKKHITDLENRIAKKESEDCRIECTDNTASYSRRLELGVDKVFVRFYRTKPKIK